MADPIENIEAALTHMRKIREASYALGFAEGRFKCRRPHVGGAGNSDGRDCEACSHPHRSGLLISRDGRGHERAAH